MQSRFWMGSRLAVAGALAVGTLVPLNASAQVRTTEVEVVTLPDLDPFF